MAKQLHKIDPRDLRPGMFIEELDRPWLETPLEFQSFYIRSLGDVKWITENCAYVMVDRGKSDSTLVFEQPVKVAAPPSRRIVKAPTGQEQIRQQVARAENTYRQAHKVMSGVLNELRVGGELDVPAVEKVIYPVIDCVLQSTDAMACVLRMKETDDYLYNHALATSIWSVVFGKSLGFDRSNLEVLGMGGLLLDIGKTRVPRELLVKTTPLDAAELAELRRHVEHGLAILDETGKVHPKVYQMVQTHHERHDGSGYPQRLAGNAIPVLGRIAGLVDTYDAMTSPRSHATPQSTYSVMRTLVDMGGKLFQAEMIERFIRVVGIFPTATLVELNSGEVAIVVEQNPLRRLRPRLMLVLDESKQLRSEFPVIDLAEVPGQASEPGALWIVQGLQPGAYGIDPREYYL
jgi:HD-GYP domain-containing protein (c-di-GMP phosphodiesterase class II)